MSAISALIFLRAFIEEHDTQIDVMQTREHGKACRDPEERNENRPNRHDFDRQQNQEGDRQLCHGGAFADPAGFDGDVDMKVSQKTDTGEYQDVAADDNHGQPSGDDFLNRQQDECRNQQ